MAVDAKRLEGLSLQQLNELLDDEEQLQSMAREMEEVQRGGGVYVKEQPLEGAALVLVA